VSIGRILFFCTFSTTERLPPDHTIPSPIAFARSRSSIRLPEKGVKGGPLLSHVAPKPETSSRRQIKWR
jgi:hypothetical protein